MRPAARLPDVQRWLGINPVPVSHLEKLVSALGGLLGVLAVYGTSSALASGPAAHWMVASMGASAVLLFAVPHGPLSQPWPVFGSHVIGAAVGVGCAQLPVPFGVDAALAVACSIGAMHLLRCTHPPGGATALTAVIGSQTGHVQGFGFVLDPVALNAATLLLVAVVFNYPFPWRRYPSALAVLAKAEQPAKPPPRTPPLDYAHLAAALRQMDSFIDISERDLLRIYELASSHAEAEAHERPRIVPTGCYSNGRFGADWEVRQVTAIDTDREGQERVHFSVVAGLQRRTCGTCTLEQFSDWTAHRVVRDENSWRPLH